MLPESVARQMATPVTQWNRRTVLRLLLKQRQTRERLCPRKTPKSSEWKQRNARRKRNLNVLVGTGQKRIRHRRKRALQPSLLLPFWWSVSLGPSSPYTSCCVPSQRCPARWLSCVILRSVASTSGGSTVAAAARATWTNMKHSWTLATPRLTTATATRLSRLLRGHTTSDHPHGYTAFQAA
eukprot:g49507.t1